jgi:hypothetical protein
MRNLTSTELEQCAGGERAPGLRRPAVAAEIKAGVVEPFDPVGQPLTLAAEGAQGAKKPV